MAAVVAAGEAVSSPPSLPWSARERLARSQPVLADRSRRAHVSVAVDAAEPPRSPRWSGVGGAAVCSFPRPARCAVPQCRAF